MSGYVRRVFDKEDPGSHWGRSDARGTDDAADTGGYRRTWGVDGNVKAFHAALGVTGVLQEILNRSKDSSA